MKFLKVKNFLCCISLETGAIVIGWLEAIFSVILIAVFALAFFGALAAGINENVFWVLVGMIVLYICYYTFVLIASIMLIRAVKSKNHKKMTIFMIILIVGLIAEFIQIWITGFSGIVISVISFAINFYCLVCVHSLYEKFKEDHLRMRGNINIPVTIYSNQSHQPYPYPQQGQVFTQQAPGVWQQQNQQQQYPPKYQVQQFYPAPTNNPV